MLHIHTSNRLEYLIQNLVSVINANPLPPLIQETIVVQSKGMERWVSMELAQYFGVWANGYFPFANAILWRLFKESLGYLPDISLFEREVMVWSIMKILPEFLEEQEFIELNNYLQGDVQQIKRFQLASRIAEVFDQYLMYRPTWIADWENGGQPRELVNDSQARWQAILWRALVERYGTQHRAKLRADFFRNVQRIAPRFQRVSVFGISALPPFHLEVLAELGRVIDVYIFLLNPCQEYWGDIVSDSEIAHIKRSHEVQYLEKGNTLLASMGKMGRDFIDILNEYPHNPHEYFDTPDEDRLLHCIQSDILHLRERGDAQKTQIDAEDKSIQIHACHSPMREVEVLHDQLLALFEKNPTILPKDVLVMMPDIETYAPFIEAVFDTIPDETKRIPFSIADRSLRGKSALIDTFFSILELSKCRFSVSEVLAVLEDEAVQRRFGLNEQDLDLIRHWIDKTGIRWGMDKSDRERQNLPAFEENTWRAGLNRLLLGYALPKSSQSFLFQGILPFDEVEGSDTLVLGKFITFIENLFNCVQSLDMSQSLTDWATFLMGVLEGFFSPDENSEAEAQEIRRVLNSLVENSNRAEFKEQVSREVMLAYLGHYLENEPLPSNFLTGCMSFCAMLPMRSIPFKVICLLGLNDQTYPRPNKPLSFDLIAKNPQRGDRSRRQNDRYLFLEALLSAREYFYMSYVGQNIHDNTVMPPSVLVSELLDYISKGFVLPASLVTSHPLQAFSPRYFNGTDKGLFSFSSEYCIASRALLNERRDGQSFFINPLPEPIAEWKTVDINRLIRFFKNPTEFLLRERLGMSLQISKRFVKETEPFEVEGLERYAFKKMLVEKSLEGMDLQAYQSIAKASGQLPHGKIGDYVYSKLIGEIQAFVKRVQQVTQQDKRDPIVVNLRIGDIHITGRLSRLWRDNLIHYRCAKLKTKDYIQVWIYHLILNSLEDKDLPRHSLLIGEDDSCEYQPVSQSQEILDTLLKLYWQGLVQPLHFFPDSSFTFAEQIKRGKTEEEAFVRAQESWVGNSNKRGEAEDEYYQLCFGPPEESAALENEQFKILAKTFFEPLLAHMQGSIRQK